MNIPLECADPDQRIVEEQTAESIPAISVPVFKHRANHINELPNEPIINTGHDNSQSDHVFSQEQFG